MVVAREMATTLISWRIAGRPVPKKVTLARLANVKKPVWIVRHYVVLVPFVRMAKRNGDAVANVIKILKNAVALLPSPFVPNPWVPETFADSSIRVIANAIGVAFLVVARAPMIPTNIMGIVTVDAT